ncbi:GNAT family N-acetyltransferase [Lyngbya confervoides]|uniref:GNAT family N-acetyltransferase n=1 Tax=Lyngbya confervoides BDU141951 TaxID=1574623 RepID=A0ABD4SZ90_9CYAN|nr:N-acetyltransferase [Lyngbya confervoides]MCM1981619.1 GNAT family N-acetyltransferase [Lyngbya confervoides BDU141951]
MRAVAALIWESAPDLFALLFGSRAQEILTDLVQRDGSRFGYPYIHVAICDRRVVGIVTLVPGEKVITNPDYQVCLNCWQCFRLEAAHRIFLDHVLRRDYPSDSAYIGNLAVASDYRRRGIGRQLLLQALTVAKSSVNAVFVSADLHNEKAQNLYKSMGFKEVETRELRACGVAIGSRIFAQSIARLPI